MNQPRADLKQFAVVIGSLTALVTALAGFWQSSKAAREEKAEAGYGEMAKALKEIQDQIHTLREDVVSQRAYVEGLRVGWINNPTVGGYGSGGGSSARRIRSATPAPPPPPQVRQTQVKQYRLPDFDSLQVKE
jgi:hypothetical protein